MQKESQAKQVDGLIGALAIFRKKLFGIPEVCITFESKFKAMWAPIVVEVLLRVCSARSTDK